MHVYVRKGSRKRRTVQNALFFPLSHMAEVHHVHHSDAESAGISAALMVVLLVALVALAVFAFFALNGLPGAVPATDDSGINIGIDGQMNVPESTDTTSNPSY